MILDTVKTILQVESATSNNWEEITKIQSIGDLEGEPDMIEVTSLSDTHRQYIRGIQNTPPIVLECWFDNATEGSNYQKLKDIELSGDVRKFRLIVKDGTTFELSGTIATQLKGFAVNEGYQFTARIYPIGNVEIVQSTTAQSISTKTKKGATE